MHPSNTSPLLSAAFRCRHRSSSAVTRPSAFRKSTRGSSSIVTANGLLARTCFVSAATYQFSWSVPERKRMIARRSGCDAFPFNTTAFVGNDRGPSAISAMGVPFVDIDPLMLGELRSLGRLHDTDWTFVEPEALSH